MSDTRTWVDEQIKRKKVIVFSKSHCPFCTKAKKVFDELLTAADYEVINIENDSRCSEIQDYLLELTGGRTVPRVFIKGKFFGGGDETQAAHRSGELKALLA